MCTFVQHCKSLDISETKFSSKWRRLLALTVVLKNLDLNLKSKEIVIINAQIITGWYEDVVMTRILQEIVTMSLLE